MTKNQSDTPLFFNPFQTPDSVIARENQTVEQIDAEIKRLEEAREKALKKKKDEDLKTVKELCKMHGFTATQLRGVLKTRKKSN